MSDIDRDALIRMTAFEHVRMLGEVHGHLTADELKPGFVFEGERIPLVNPQRDLVAWIIPKNILLIGFSTLGVVQMPHKFNAARRHKFDKVQYRVINWAEYNESLRQRGDLTIWVSEEAQSVWSAPRRTSRGGQRRYSDLAIVLASRSSARANG